MSKRTPLHKYFCEFRNFLCIFNRGFKIPKSRKKLKPDRTFEHYFLISSFLNTWAFSCSSTVPAPFCPRGLVVMLFLLLYTYDLPVDISSLFSLCSLLALSLNVCLNFFTVGMSWYITLSTKLVFFFFSALLSPLST